MITELLNGRYHITLENGVTVSSSNYERALDAAFKAIGRSAVIEFRRRRLTQAIDGFCRAKNEFRRDTYRDHITDCKEALELALQS